jgi:hypothetical protein
MLRHWFCSKGWRSRPLQLARNPAKGFSFLVFKSSGVFWIYIGGKRW